MAVIGTFGSFTCARLAIYASQASLNVTGNNIANINTEGYTRQRMDLVSLNSGGMARYANSFNINIGYGVLCESVSQVRDPYLDIRFRNEQASLGQTTAKMEGLEQLSQIWDEVGRGEQEFGVIELQFNDLLAQLQGLSGTPGSKENDTVVRTSADTLVKLFNHYANEMNTVAENQEKSLRQDVTTVNTLLTKIQDLNVEIRKASIYGDKALELRDARNVAIDKLSSYMKINVTYTTEKIDQYNEVEKLVISLADTGNPPVELVNGIYATQISIPEKVPAGTQKDTDNPQVKQEEIDPSHPSYNDANSVDNKYMQIVLDPLIDKKGRFMKDPKTAQPKDEYVVLGDNTLTGSLQAKRELLTEEGEFADKDDLTTDPKAGEKRGIPFYQRALDAMVQKFASEFNKANQMDPNKAQDYYETGAGGFIDKASPDPDNPNFVNVTLPNGNTEVLSMAHLLSTDEAVVAAAMEALRQNGQLTPEYSYYNGGVLFSSGGNSDDPTGITAENITISKSWENGDVRLLLTKNPYEDGLEHSTDQDNIRHMISLMGEKLDYIASDTVDKAEGGKYFSGTFQEMLANTNVLLGAERQVTVGLYDEYSTLSLDLDNKRSSVSGVDLNEEATSMMQFQKSYSAACQLLTTLDSMLDRLINGTI